jgi:hypothetical protein
MEPFTKALEVVARVMRESAATHPDLYGSSWCSSERYFNGGPRSALSCTTGAPDRSGSFCVRQQSKSTAGQRSVDASVASLGEHFNL